MAFVKYFDRNTWKKCTGTVNDEESLTDQSFKFDMDINEIILRYRKGLVPRTAVREPRYDLNNCETSSWTFEDWQNEKAKIERKFLHLTPEMREKFKSPQAFFEYCSNPENYVITDNGVEEKVPLTPLEPSIEQPSKDVQDPKV